MGRLRPEHESAVRRAARAQSCRRTAHPLAQPEEAVPERPSAPPTAACPSSRTSMRERVVAVGGGGRRRGCACACLSAFVSALLHDPVRRQLDAARAAGEAGRRCRRLAASPARLTSSKRRRTPSMLGCGARSAGLVVGAHGAEQAPHLGQRLAAGHLDVVQRVLVGRQRGGQPMADGAGLEHHDAHGVGDDVVELARDASPLLGDGEPRGRLALRLRVLGPALGVLRALLARGSAPGRCPGHRDQHAVMANVANAPATLGWSRATSTSATAAMTRPASGCRPVPYRATRKAPASPRTSAPPPRSSRSARRGPSARGRRTRRRRWRAAGAWHRAGRASRRVRSRRGEAWSPQGPRHDLQLRAGGEDEHRDHEPPGSAREPVTHCANLVRAAPRPHPI